jgi:hypothetical protein
MSAGVDVWIDHVPKGVTLCDARGVHTGSTSEWVVTAILASVREFPRFTLTQAAHRWKHVETDTLAGKRVLIVGAGDIGEAVCRRLEPFGVTQVRVARRRRDGVYPVTDLPGVLPDADIVVVQVPLTAATRGWWTVGSWPAGGTGRCWSTPRGDPLSTRRRCLRSCSPGGSGRRSTSPIQSRCRRTTRCETPGLLLAPHVGGSVTSGSRRRTSWSATSSGVTRPASP